MRDDCELTRRCRGDQTKGRLDAENPAERARNADRSAAVAAEMQRSHAGRRSDRGAGAAAARRVAAAPWIASDAGERAIADRLPAELGRGGLAEQHRAVLAQAR